MEEDMPQSHTVQLIYRGTFQDLLLHLQEKGIEYEFIPPGLKGSQSVLMIDSKLEEKPEKERE